MSGCTHSLDLHHYREAAAGRRRLKKRAQLLKLEALKAADFRCTKCGREDRLTIHHLTKIHGQRDERTVLCVPCHRAVDHKREVIRK